MKKVVAAIEARMSSSRFPGKILKKLAGKSILWHVVHRLKQTDRIDKIVIATSVEKDDDVLVEFAIENQISIVRGPIDNLLKRHLMVVDQFDPDIIVRITSDCPLIDPILINNMIEILEKTDAGFCTSRDDVPCIHEGIDPISTEALLKLNREASDNKIAMEHVSGYFKANKDFVKIEYISIEEDCQFSGARVSVDTPQDLNFLNQVYSELNAEAGELDIRDVVKLLKIKPELLKINAGVRQKKLNEIKKTAIFRCDGGGKIGFGHIYRCISLAEKLRTKYSFGIIFCVNENPEVQNILADRNFKVALVNPSNEFKILSSIIEDNFSVLIFDQKSGLGKDEVLKLKRNSNLIVDLDNVSDRRIVSDICIIPPVPQVKELEWNDFSGKLLSDWKYVILRDEFMESHEYYNYKSNKILVTFGGSDPYGMTIEIIKALDNLKMDIDVDIIIGPGFRYKEILNELLATVQLKYNLIYKPQKISKYMIKAKLAIASFGVSAYELASLGIPSLLFTWTKEDLIASEIFINEGIAEVMGIPENFDIASVSKKIQCFFNNEEKLRQMNKRALSLIDGKGSSRITELFNFELEKKLTND